MQKPSIAVIAHKGMVGSTVYNYFKDKGHYVMGWSRSTRDCEYAEINNYADYVFICVPTPYDWKKNGIDLSPLESTLEQLHTKDNAVVIIKSTVPPGTTQILQDKYPYLNLLFNPEFLSEATAREDFINPDRQIIGYTDKTKQYAYRALHLLPMSPYDAIMTSTEAEIAKYVNNFHGSLMVIFANLIYDMARITNSDYDVIRQAAEASKWVGSPMTRMYWNVNHGGFRGYGGKCFPKDMHNLINWFNEYKLPAEILEATIEANKRLLQVQGLDEEKAEKISTRI